ncbi:MAG: hypothetical protein NUW24_11730 [Anaerolineae bacterium]|nr:hypothetical protein [Anaerolineae bacterium]MDH7474738.1 hypothetical protein [Anaerolineae bacterium]
MRNFFIGTTFIILLLTACGPAITSATVATPVSAQMTFDSPLLSEEVLSLPTPEPLPSLEDTGKGQTAIEGAVIIYRRSGGFAGVHEQWTIYPDGRIMAADGCEWRVSPEQVEQLLAEIESLGFFEMSSRYVPLNTCCDRFTYEITVRHGDTVNTVTTIDAAPDAPSELWHIIDEISHLASK